MGTAESRNIDIRLLQVIMKRKLSYYGYILSKDVSCLEKKIIQSTICHDIEDEEDSITKWTGPECDRLLHDRQKREDFGGE